MQYDQPLISGTLIKRYKRFLADVRLEDGSEITVHCPNTGSMKNCAEPGWPVWLWDSQNPKRKYQHSWEWVAVQGKFKACINTTRANQLVAEALENKVISELSDYSKTQGEPKVEDGRLDFLLHADESDTPESKAYVEVKSVTLLNDLQGENSEPGLGSFPDAVTDRGLKHLKRLLALHQQGYRAVLLFCVAHEGIERVRPADEIDPKYGAALRDVVAQGVEVLAYRVDFGDDNMALTRRIPVEL